MKNRDQAQHHGQFVFNGHNWDAYEVLGVGFGCSLEGLQAAFNGLAQDSSPEMCDFLREAMATILKAKQMGGE